MRFYGKFYKPINLLILKITILAGILFQTVFTLVAALFLGREKSQLAERMNAFYVMVKRVFTF
jgi:hypothetical protein